MAFQYLGHQPGRRAAQSRELLEQGAAFLAPFDGGDQGVGLPLIRRSRVTARFFSSGV